MLLHWNPDMGTVLVSCDTGTVPMSHKHVTGHKNRPHVRVEKRFLMPASYFSIFLNNIL